MATRNKAFDATQPVTHTGADNVLSDATHSVLSGSGSKVPFASATSAPNHAPSALADIAGVEGGIASTEGAAQTTKKHSANKTHAANVLANDTDPDLHDVLHVSAIGFGTTTAAIALGGDATIKGAQGTLTMNAEGSYSYAANQEIHSVSPHVVAQDRFIYTVDDGHGGTAHASLTLTITQPDQQYVAGRPGETLKGGDGREALDGGLGNEIVIGGNGDDVLIGGPNNMLTGGHGSDTFVFGPHFGQNTITDFDARLDLVQIDHTLFHDFAAVQSNMHQIGADTVIILNAHDTITLTNVALSIVHANDFLFA